jgi:hypothetical protein
MRIRAYFDPGRSWFALCLENASGEPVCQEFPEQAHADRKMPFAAFHHQRSNLRTMQRFRVIAEFDSIGSPRQGVTRGRI